MSFIQTYTYNPATEKVVPKGVVVLDLDPTVTTEDLGARRSEAQRLVDMLRETADNFFTPDAAALARNVVKQIEAQTKPPRMPEPGLWGVVRAPQPVSQIPVEWVHGPVNVEGNDWHSTTGNWHRVWSDLIDPALVRPGIGDES